MVGDQSPPGLLWIPYNGNGPRESFMTSKPVVPHAGAPVPRHGYYVPSIENAQAYTFSVADCVRPDSDALSYSVLTSIISQSRNDCPSPQMHTSDKLDVRAPSALGLQFGVLHVKRLIPCCDTNLCSLRSLIILIHARQRTS